MTDSQESTAETNAQDIWIPAFKEAGVAFAVAALLFIVFYVFAFRWIHPEFAPFMDRQATHLIAPGKDLIPVSLGGFRVEGSTAIVEDFNGDEAILALPRPFQAEDYPFIKVNLSGFTRYSKFKILWRRVDDPLQTHALEFNRNGDEATQIAMVYGNENYRGQIADIALLFYDGPALGVENNNDLDLVIRSVEFRPFSARAVAEQLFKDWTNPPLWTAASHNVVNATHLNGMLPPNLVINLIIIVSGLLLLVASRTGYGLNPASTAQYFATFSSLFIYGLILSEVLRWQWRVELLMDAHERYAGKVLEERAINNPQRCARFPTDCKLDSLPFY